MSLGRPSHHLRLQSIIRSTFIWSSFRSKPIHRQPSSVDSREGFLSHISHLSEVLTVLHRDKFFATLKECEFGSSTVHFLRYIISSQGLAVDLRKIFAIQSWPIPTIINQVRRFHGLASFYRRFVPQFSSIMAPISGCIRDSQFVWTLETEQAFTIIKDKLCTAPVLTLPDFTLLFELHFDASKPGIGAVHSQKGQAKAFYSKKLAGARSRYITMTWNSMQSCRQ